MSKSKNTGKLIMAIGGICILASLILLFYNNYTDNNAGDMAYEVLSVLDMENITADTENIADYLLNPDIKLPVKTVDGKDYVGTITIPAISKELPVMAQWSAENSKIAPCVYEGTPYKNTMIIAGHNYKKHFGPIDNLVAGDMVYFKDMDGNVFSYEVAYTQIIDGSDYEGMVDGDWDLTLFTCTYGGTQRITVRCVSVD